MNVLGKPNIQFSCEIAFGKFRFLPMQIVKKHVKLSRYARYDIRLFDVFKRIANNNH